MTYLPITELASYLNVSDDDAGLASLLISATSALDELKPMPVCPAASGTVDLWADDGTVWLTDCVSVSGCTDIDGNALAYIAEPAKRGGYDRLILHDRLDAMVKVTGTFGVSALPPRVVRAIVVTAGTWYRRQNLGDGNAIGRLDAVPTEARDLYLSGGRF